MEVYKLTRPDQTTHNACKWVKGRWKETDGSGKLCGPGWLHSYSSPLLAVLHNPIHAAYHPIILWRAEAGGEYKNDRGLKQGHTRLRLIERIEPVSFTDVQRAAYAIYCALATYPLWETYDAKGAYKAWADAYLFGKDRTARAADAADAAAYAADAARAAADAAYAAYAADAAAYAADAARAAARAADAARAAARAADAAARAADAAPIDFHALAEKALLVQ